MDSYLMLIEAIKIIAVVFMVLTLIPVLIWWERKGSAYIQDRRGPNRANIFGMRLGGFIHNLADVLKLLFKEDIIPTKSHKFLYVVAPMIVLSVALVIPAIVPFAAPLKIGDFVLTFQIADLNIGVLYILAISSLSVYGVMLAGWSSGGAYSLFGGLRASAQLISYEVALGLALISVLMYAGTVRLDEMVSIQGANPLNWNIVRQPLAFLIFFTCLFAETNRNPFDLPEGESELVAGYHTEYSSMKFAMFFMAEYAHIVAGSMVVACLFLGGWQVPFLNSDELRRTMPLVLKFICAGSAFILIYGGTKILSCTKKFKWGDLRDFEPAYFGVPMVVIGILLGMLVAGGMFNNMAEWVRDLLVVFLQMGAFLIKVLFICALFIWVRWTLPRFRYDQLMKLGWNVMIPLALINIVITGLWFFI